MGQRKWRRPTTWFSQHTAGIIGRECGTEEGGGATSCLVFSTHRWNYREGMWDRGRGADQLLGFLNTLLKLPGGNVGQRKGRRSVAWFCQHTAGITGSECGTEDGTHDEDFFLA